MRLHCTAGPGPWGPIRDSPAACPRRSRARPVLGTASRSLAAAGKATLTVRLSAAARKRLRRAKRLTLTLRSTAPEAGAKPLVTEQLVAVK
jgi:hypothetical protein